MHACTKKAPEKVLDMKRTLTRARECDAKVLSGRPSFVNTLTLPKARNRKAAPAGLLAINEGAGTIISTPSAGSKTFAATSRQFERSSHSGRKRITKNVYETSAITIIRGMIPHFNDDGPPQSTQQLVPISKRISQHNPYSVAGTKFRQSTAGNALNGHSGGINPDNLPPELRREFIQHRESDRKTREILESGSIGNRSMVETSWNRNPHTQALQRKLELPSLRKDNPGSNAFPLKPYERGYRKKKQKQLKNSYGATGAVHAKKYLPDVSWVRAGSSADEREAGASPHRKDKRYRKKKGATREPVAQQAIAEGDEGDESDEGDNADESETGNVNNAHEAQTRASVQEFPSATA